jgi:hypothetical protein
MQASARDIIAEILRNMREGLEPLQYSTLAPAVYHVYLHSKDYERLRSIFPRIAEEAERALEDEIGRLNASRGVARLLEKVPCLRRRIPKVKRAQEGGWEIHFYEDVDEELQPGEILINSDLALTPKPEYGAGAMTKRVTTRAGDPRSSSQSFETPVSQHATERVYAEIHYQDDRGAQTFLVKKDRVVIGRGGPAHWVDLKLYSQRDVSREHARLRRDPATGNFYLTDVSQFGTTVNGAPAPSSVEIVEGQRREKNLEVPLPEKARIVLAGVVTLEFEVAGRS